MKDSEYLTLITNAENFLKCKPNRISAVDIIHDILLAEPEIDFESANKNIKKTYQKLMSDAVLAISHPDIKFYENQDSYNSWKIAYHLEDSFKEKRLRQRKNERQHFDSSIPHGIKTKIGMRAAVLSKVFGITLTCEQKNYYAKQMIP